MTWRRGGGQRRGRCEPVEWTRRPRGGTVYTRDLKSLTLTGLRVRIPPRLIHSAGYEESATGMPNTSEASRSLHPARAGRGDFGSIGGAGHFTSIMYTSCPP